MKHKRFEENILVDEAYTNYSRADKNEDRKKTAGIAKHFAETLEYDEKKKWFHQLPQEPPVSSKTLTPEKIEELRKEASSALHGDTLAYETKSNRSGSSDQQWARTLLNKGAIGDRVAAATILIQDNPIFNLTALTNLINQVKPAKKKDGIAIIDALSELLVSELLIPDTKLRTFEQHPLAEIEEMTSGNKQAKRNVLKLWFYEDRLKELYGTYVEALNKFAHDSVEANKEKAVSAMSYLLMHHPEREKMLLNNIINKLGDPSQAVASKVVYHLCQLLFNHPNMKSVVLAEIEKMLFRTNISPRAQYYAICFLNQFYLGKDDSKIAENLIRIYFSFFKAAIKKGEIESRLMSAILTGVKRAYPFADKERLTQTSTHIDAIYKLVHLARMNIAIHALALLHHVTGGAEKDSDRFYTALYRKLTNPEIFNTTHSALLFSVIYKCIKADTNVERVTAMIKRLLQLCAYMTPAQACGMLFLISQVLKDSNKKEAIKLTWTKRELPEDEVKEEKPEKSDEPNAETSTTEVNNTIESVEDTTTVEEVKTEDKKVNLLIGDKKDLWADDDEEHYVDLKLDSQGQVKVARRRAAAAPGWLHKTLARADDDDEKQLKNCILMKKTANVDKEITSYSPYARNPVFAGAHHSAHIELSVLGRHFHPTVALYAQRICNNQIIQYSGDPLKDFSGIRFLDRFVFKNPQRRPEVNEDEGVKTVRGSHPKFAVRKNYVAKGIRSIPVTSSTYLNEDSKNIPVDERFLYDYLQKRRSAKASDDEDSDSDNDSVTSEDFEQYLDSVTGTAAAEDSDEELDFLTEMEKAKQNKKSNKKSKDEDEQSDDQLGGDDDDDDEENEAGGFDDDDDDMEGEEGGLDFGDDEELLLEGSDDEEDQIEVPGASGKKGGKNKLGLKLKGKDDLGSLFASAEEFSTLLEDTATNSKQGSSNAVSNTDNSSMKQLAWEDTRDKWLKGYNRKMHGAKKGNFKKGKKPQNGGFNKMADKKAGKRKGGSIGAAASKKKKFK
ncbi:CCAAT/enhancer-binding protein zeta [Plutella xylostella]|uniref:CCAAT/enhancer-binding protein zeta n=1 Tax=Plutella xylostella TaxID=51655 RepID=UPI002032A6D9|nr:CCAAT/enhancer-binding protein zeta [Plutella xylostella]